MLRLKSEFGHLKLGVYDVSPGERDIDQSLMAVSGDLGHDLVTLDVWWHSRYFMAAAWTRPVS